MNSTFSIILTSTNYKVLTAYKTFLINNFKLKNCIILPNKKKQFTILKAPHIHKKSRDQYELYSYKQILNFEGMSTSTFFKFRYFIAHNIPANLTIKFTLTNQV